MSLLEKPIKKLSRGLSLSLNKLAKEVTPDQVHHLRTTIRRIETLVASTSLGPSKRQEKSLKTMAGLRKRAGRVRDFDVQLDLLTAIANGSTVTDRGLMAGFLKRKREKQAERLQSAVTEVKNSKFALHMKSVFHDAAEAPQPRGQGGHMARARQQLSSLSREFLDQHPLKPGVLHEVRIKLKMVRYQTELAQESEERRHLLGELETVQDSLGSWHDWEELAKTAEKQFAERANCPLLLEIRALMAAHQSAARAAVMRLFSSYAPHVRRQLRVVGSVRPIARRA